MTHSILVVGVGSIGERHARCFQRTGRADVSICEINDDLRTRIAESYGMSQAFDSLDAAIDTAPDAAVICTPAHLHIPQALRLADSGIPILIEKPLSTTFDGVEVLKALLAERKLAASVAYVTRAHPTVAAMREAIQSGCFGRPLNFVFTSGQHFPLYRPAYREIYYTRHETGGGAIQDALTHGVNAVEWIVGPVTELLADAAHLALPGVEVEDTVHLLTRHGGVMGSFTLNQHQAPNESTLTVVCERGTARFEAHRTRWLSCTEPGADWQVEEEFALERDDLFVRQAEQFLDLLEGRRPPGCTIDEAEQTLRVNLAALASARDRTWKRL